MILILTLCAVSLCLIALFALLGAEGGPARLPLALAVASVSLGWFTLHTVTAFRYAHLYYYTSGDSGSGDTGGLEFPGTDEPHMMDFLYYSLVVGMTSQVSDVQTQLGEHAPHHARAQRDLVLLQHGHRSRSP